jgi:hypothetical protein
LSVAPPKQVKHAPTNGNITKRIGF